MKERFTDEERRALTLYRIENAHRAIDDSASLHNLGSYNAAVNRIYYACFYALLALFLQEDINTKNHSGVKTMFNLHFVSKGRVSKELGYFYTEIFRARGEGDYDDFVYFESQEIEQYIADARLFIATIEKLIH
ncbi:HEPN domain-containing protein [Bacteroides sp. OttesenSCG-928-E20]|nr:HEPN domain-containing protein [Bacteroides sp. OttesenSCG-928-N06]MDL2299349.1 HEPN domain-containing protein [Bacteroides sp. OttesenSCG-928-E20]MDL2304687.1 HEPN domain-containing protein [Bacteroides sp. OttesenSCG-928-D19]